MTRLVDSHCHLDFKDFEGELDQIIERADAAGVGLMVTIGTKLRDFDKVLKVAETLYRACSNATAEQLAEIAADPEFATAPRFFKAAMRSFGTPLPTNANRMVQNV